MICIPSQPGSALTVKNKFGRFRSLVTFKRVVEITSFAIYVIGFQENSLQDIFKEIL